LYVQFGIASDTVGNAAFICIYTLHKGGTIDNETNHNADCTSTVKTAFQASINNTLAISYKRDIQVTLTAGSTTFNSSKILVTENKFAN